ncbi:MAG: CD225/dispanin family protein [Paludibacteraceae bacterium]|nr:CD225/dispanin family protein [Paludibacteraceae bacterium]
MDEQYNQNEHYTQQQTSANQQQAQTQNPYQQQQYGQYGQPNFQNNGYQQQQQYQQSYQQMPQQGGNIPNSLPPNNHLTKAILSTIFCCMPFGIVAIVKASQVNTFWKSGFWMAAQQSAQEANKWSNWSIGLGLAQILISAIYFGIIFAAGAGSFLGSI